MPKKDSSHASSTTSRLGNEGYYQTDAYCPTSHRRSFSESSATSLSAKPPSFQCRRFLWRKPTAQPQISLVLKWKCVPVSQNEHCDCAELRRSIACDNRPPTEAVFGTGYENSSNRNELSETLGNTLNVRRKKGNFFAKKPVNLMVTTENLKFFYIHR